MSNFPPITSPIVAVGLSSEGLESSIRAACTRLLWCRLAIHHEICGFRPCFSISSLAVPYTMSITLTLSI